MRPSHSKLRGCIRAGVLGLILSPALASQQAGPLDSAPLVHPAQGTLQAAFSPWDDVEALVVKTIDAAQVQVLLQAYLLTSRIIARSLVAAHQRGIDVRVLADEVQSHGESSRLGQLVASGIPVWLETRYQNAHNKVIVVDAAGASPVVVTGSYNFTWAAQHKNAENILIVRQNPALATRYAANWERHRTEAVAYPPFP